jgi:hypothetical protein
MKLIFLLLLLLLINFTNSKKNIYITGRIENEIIFFKGLLLLNLELNKKLKFLNLKLNFIQNEFSISPLNFENVIIVNLVKAKSNFNPISSNIVPNIPGNLPWDGIKKSPIGYFDFTKTGGIYQFPEDLIYFNVLKTNSEFRAGNPLILNYDSNFDLNFKEIELKRNEKIYLLVKLGSQDNNFLKKGLQFNGYFSYE